MRPKQKKSPPKKSAKGLSAVPSSITFQQALELHQKGRLSEAGAAYELVLAAQPDHFEALHWLGVIAIQSRDFPRAVELIGKAIEIHPINAVFHSNLGAALKNLRQFEAAIASYDKAIALRPDIAGIYSNRGNAQADFNQVEAAIASYDKAVEIQPDHVEAYFNRGNAQKKLKRPQAAIASYDKAVAIKPDFAEAWLNRGLALQELKQSEAAIASYDRAIAIKPDFENAYFNRGNAQKELDQMEAAIASYHQAIAIKPDFANAYCNLGNALYALKQFDAAIHSHERAIAIRPDFAEAWSNCGNAQKALKQFEAAIASYDQAIAIRPDFADAHSNRGVAMQELKRWDAAIASYDKAIASKPDYADAYFNRGNAQQTLCQLEAAIASYDQAISIRPDYAEALFNKSVTLLLKGDYLQGWALYEWRWQQSGLGLKRRIFPKPLWLGAESLKGKRILLHSEQGLGDTIQFCRYAKVVSDMGGTVMMGVPPPLLGLLQNLEGVSRFIESGAVLSELDFHCPLMSLPLACKTELHSIPARQAYLQSDAGKVSLWNEVLGVKTKPRIGLVWSGNPEHTNDANRSIALSALIPYLPDAFEYVSLQKEIREDDKTTLAAHPNIRFVGDQIQDFTDTAALCDLMDVVISVDTSVAHLSGALGKPTWILLAFSPDSRWLLNRSDSPWYPSVRLYRQPMMGDWTAVLKAAGADLVKLSDQLQTRKSIAQVNTKPNTNSVSDTFADIASEPYKADFQCAFELHQKGQLAEAKAVYTQILTAQPEHFDALHQLGLMALQTNNHQLAADLIGRAIAIRPDRAAFYYNLGVALQALNRYSAAIVSYDNAIALQPDFAEAYSNRGLALQELKQFEAAIASFDKGIAIKPGFADAYYNRGNVQKQLKQIAAAIASYDQAIALQPEFPKAYSNRGNAFRELGQLDAAIASYDRAIAIKPDYADAYLNRGNALQIVQQLEAAIASYDQAIAVKPDFPQAHFNKSIALLLAGDYRQGWQLHERRWQCDNLGLRQRPYGKPLWLGSESLQGKRILLHSEAGLGDTIQFCRYASLVSEMGATVILEAPKTLLGLLHSLEGVSTFLEAGAALPSFDTHCPLMSLPLACKTEVASIPITRAYLHSDARKVSHWKEKLGIKHKPRVGLVWSGSAGSSHKIDSHRSIALASITPYLPDTFEYISLQKELRDTDKATLASHSNILFFGDQIQDFSDTAALCDLVDVVVSIDTSVAHLSCALGKTTWIMLPFGPDWRWFLDRSNSPWYPSARLYRQKIIGDWTGVLTNVRADLLSLPGPHRDGIKTTVLSTNPTRISIGQALELHQKGQLSQAKTAYEKILSEQPEHFDALHLLGVIAFQNKEYQRSVDWIENAIAIHPGNADFHCNLGAALRELGRFEASAASFYKATQLKPDFALAHYNRGLSLQKLKQLEAAIASYDSAIAIKPDYKEAYANRGVALHELKQFEAAVADYEKAISLQPDSAENHLNLGGALRELKQLEAAVDRCNQAISLKADYAEAYACLGLLFYELKQFSLAIENCSKAIAIKPECAEAYLNRGLVLNELMQFDQALASYDRAIAINPDCAEAYSNRGIVLQRLMQVDAAIASYDQAITIKPDSAHAHLNKSFSLLLKGDFENGWAFYEWRWNKDNYGQDLPVFPRPLWLGVDSLKGKRILLHSEQGFGDAIQFGRYAKLVSERGATVILCVPKPMIGLLGQLEGVSHCVESGLVMLEFDYHCPLLSLPLAFKTRLETIPVCQSYLSSKAGKVSLWDKVLGVKTKLRIGLMWSGNPDHKGDFSRSIALSSLTPYLPDTFEYVSLQKEIRQTDKAALENNPHIRHFGDQIQDFTDTAALCDLMDLVISVDTSVAHLSGALGKPTWILLPFNPDWRWLIDRSDSPWYPSVQLYRQQAIGDWTTVFSQVQKDLVELLNPTAKKQIAIIRLAETAQPGFDQAAELHQKGQLAQAKAAYEDILKKNPRHFDSLHRLGIIALQMQDHRRAVELIGKAIEIYPCNADFHSNLAAALQSLNQFDAASASCEKAIAIKPNFADAHYNHGLALQALGQFEAAIASYDQAIAIRPDYADAYSNRGIVQKKLRRLEAAIASYDQAIAIKPNYAEAWFNRGVALKDMKQFGAAIASYDRALAIRTNYADAYCNRGNALALLTQLDSAIADYDQAVAIKPELANAYYSKSTALLMKGDFDQGWPLYEWRWKCNDLEVNQRDFSQPLWLGKESLKGKRILLHGEQGFGDTIQFCRYTKLVNELGATVILQAPKALMKLMQNLVGISEFIASGSKLPKFYYQCPLLSLPLAFRTQLHSIPGGNAYLHSEAGTVADWNEILGARTRPRIGLVWSGNPQHQGDSSRSIALSALTPYLPDGHEYISLQKEIRDSDKPALTAHPGIRHFGDRIQDFSDTAALCELMDVVVSVDTSVAHLSGALGKPTWILLPFCPDWRWLLKRSDSPWYPSVRLYRQESMGDWSSVLSKINADLIKRFNPPPEKQIASEGLAGSSQIKFQQALTLHQKGQLAQAEAAYQEILSEQPDHFDSLHLLGVIAVQIQDYSRAVELIKRAIELFPSNAEFHSNLGNALLGLRQFSAAIASYDQAILLKPDFADAYSNRGAALEALGQLEAAIASFDQAISIKPDYATAYSNRANIQKQLGQFSASIASYDKLIALQPGHAEACLNRGISLQALNQFEAAIASYDQAIEIKPDFAEAYSNRGVALKELKQLDTALASIEKAITIRPDFADAYLNRGNTLQDLKQLEMAIASYNKAIAIKPDFAAAYSNRGTALQSLNQLDAAIASFDQALAIKPDYAEAWFNRGVALKESKRLNEALHSYERAIAHNPDYAEAYSNRGIVLQQLMQVDAAIASYDKAIAIKPDCAPAYLNKSLSLLLKGDYDEGWRLYEWRWKHSSLGLKQWTVPQPLWLGGESLKGKTIFLHSEQGLGDTLQFCRYAKVVRNMGATVLMGVPTPLLGLLKGLEGVSRFVERGAALPEFDTHCPLMSLPLACKTQLSSIPSSPAYLHSDAAKVSRWQKKLGAKHKPRVGLVWNGSNTQANDTNRSVELSTLIPYLSDSFEHISLQKEIRDSDRATLAAHPNIRFFGDQIDDFTDTAALCDLMDVVISVCTSVAHLSGALGKNTWILLPFNADWRWLLDRSDSPWYPSVRLYRQNTMGDWDSVLSKVKADLSALVPKIRDKNRSIDNSSENIRSIFQKAEDLHRQGRLNDAQVAYEKVLNLQRDHFESLHWLGVIAFQNHDYARAVELIGKAIGLHSTNAVFHFHLAIALQTLQQLEAAIGSYDKAIAIKPDYVEAYSNRGVAQKDLKQFEAAIGSYDQAIAIKPDFAEAYYNRGNVQKDLTQFEAAIASYDQAVAIKPDHASAYYNRGIALKNLNRFAEAINSYDRAIAIKPDYADAYLNRGLSFQELKQLEAAIASFDRVIAIKPDFADAYFKRGIALHQFKQIEAAIASYDQAIALNPNFAEAYSNRGVALKDLKQPEAALASLEKAIAIRPDFADAYLNRGNILHVLKQPLAAIESYDKAIAIKPDFAEAYSNRGTALQGLRQLNDAIASYDRAIALRANYAEAYTNRGIALQDLTRLDEAITSYDRAIAIEPDNAEALFNKSLSLLMKGDLDKGLPLYEWRWKQQSDRIKHLFPQARHLPQTLWLGVQALKGKRILLHSEQGFGDTIQFCRYAKRVSEMGATVMMEVHPSLIPLLSGLDGVNICVATGSTLPAFDYHCPMMSLPLAFKTHLENIPSSPAYLRSDANKVSQWQQKLGPKTRLRVGLAWSGNLEHTNDANRSIALSALISYLPDAFEYVSLQKEIREDDKTTLAAHPNIRFVGDQIQDFTDTAALCDLMDVVISVDTSVAHLSGALGKPTWILLPFRPDWRWLLNRSDSPWYPSVRLYRQPMMGDWTAVLKAAGADLVKLSDQLQTRKSIAQVNTKPNTNSVSDTFADIASEPYKADFQRAFELHQKGQLAEAKAVYTQILTAQPEHFDALHQLGLMALQTNNHQLAADLIGRAIAIRPDRAALHSNLGAALKGLKQYNAAVVSYNKAIAIQPQYAEAYSNRGIALQASNQLESAIASYDEATAIKPDYAVAWFNRGTALQASNQLDAAIESYDKAVAFKPDFAHACFNRGLAQRLLGHLDNAVASYDQAIAIKPDFAEAYFNRGLALHELKQIDAAIESYDKAIAINPNFANAYCNRGNALKELKRIEVAIASYDQAIATQPDLAEAHCNRGNALRDLGQLDAAIASYNTAIGIRPDYADAYSNRGIVLQQFMQVEAAIDDYDKAIKINPDCAPAYLNKSFTLLLTGDFEHGWPLYEWRWKGDKPSHHHLMFPQPLWLGAESLKSKRIVLYCEQGLGDTIQFCRYAKVVSEMGATVMMLVPGPLMRLLQGLEGVSRFIESGSVLPNLDYRCPLMSLPLACKTELHSIPSRRAYLHSDSAKVSQWEKNLGVKKKPRVGLVWSGNPEHTNDANRSIALSSLTPCLPNSFEYVSLQKEVQQTDRTALKTNSHIRHFGDQIEDFSDTAALCELMDVVITVDTSTAHLSGSLGKPTWILLPFNPDWRWLMDRRDSPWYPSVRLYRQTVIGDWASVLSKVRADLEARIDFI